MNEEADYEKRSQEIADTTRRTVVAFNTAGIGASLTMAGSLAAQKIHPGWVAWPALLFVLGLVATGASLLLAKHRTLKRRDANVTPAPDFKAFYWRSFTWDLVALLLFAAGCVVGLYTLAALQFPRP